MQDDDIFGAARRKSENENRLMLVGGALIVSVAGAAITYLSKRSDKRNLEKAIIEEQAVALKIGQMSTTLDECLAADYFVLDSNVWMCEGAGPLFDELMHHAQAKRKRLSVLGCQKREMEKLKKAAKDQGTPFNVGESARARHGINRMIAFLDRGLLLSVDDTAIARGRTHADEIFVAYFRDAVKKGKSVKFVTDDRGLKLAMHEVAQAQPELCEIIDRDMLIALAEELCDLRARHENISARLQRLKKVARPFRAA